MTCNRAHCIEVLFIFIVSMLFFLLLYMYVCMHMYGYVCISDKTAFCTLLFLLLFFLHILCYMYCFWLYDKVYLFCMVYKLPVLTIYIFTQPNSLKIENVITQISKDCYVHVARNNRFVISPHLPLPLSDVGDTARLNRSNKLSFLRLIPPEKM